jgi:fibronectin type 3 domain-containing protein
LISFNPDGSLKNNQQLSYQYNPATMYYDGYETLSKPIVAKDGSVYVLGFEFIPKYQYKNNCVPTLFKVKGTTVSKLSLDEILTNGLKNEMVLDESTKSLYVPGPKGVYIVDTESFTIRTRSTIQELRSGLYIANDNSMYAIASDALYKLGEVLLPPNQSSLADHTMKLVLDQGDKAVVAFNNNYPDDIVDYGVTTGNMLRWQVATDGLNFQDTSVSFGGQPGTAILSGLDPSKAYYIRTLYKNNQGRVMVYQRMILRPEKYSGVPMPTENQVKTLTAGPSISLGSPVIVEDASNDGSISAKQLVTVTGGTLAQDLSSGITVNNLPAGLTTTVNRLSDTQFEIVFNGKATNHANINDVLNASVTLTQDKITGATGPVTSGTFTFDFNDPVPKISIETATIKEADANDGSITQKQVVNLTDGVFTSDVASGVTVTNLPAGLTASVTRVSDTQLEISFLGKAANHANANDVSNVQVTIDKSKVLNATANLVATFGIDFQDAFQVSNLQAAIVNEHVNLSWNNLQGADSYLVERFVNGVKEKSVTVTNSIFQDDSVVANTTYEYRVTPKQGVQLGTMKSVTITTPADLQNPGPSYGKPEVTDSTSIRIPLNIPGAVRYEVFRNGTEVYDGPGPEYVDRNLPTGQTYQYKVVGYDAQGNPIDTITSEISLPAVPVQMTVGKATLVEAPANDGSITDKQTITITGGTFASDVESGVTVSNVPVGLTANVVRVSDTQLEISFSGKAAAHENTNDVSNVQVTIDKSKVMNASENLVATFGIDFQDAQVPFEVSNLQAAIVNDTVNLSWDAVQGADSYIVERYAEGIKEKSRTVTDTVFVDDTAISGMTYEYRVTPKKGTEVGNPKSVTIDTPLDFEDGGQTDPTYGNEPQVEDSTSIRIPLNIQGAVRYEVYRNDTKVYDGPGPEYVDRNLQAGVSYRYKVIGFDAQGNPVDTKNSDVKIENQTVQNLKATDVQKDRVVLTFDPISGASDYIVERYKNGQLEKRSSTATHTFTDLTVAANTTYTYKVKAVINGNQTIPASVTVKTLEDVQDPVVNNVTVSTSDVTHKSVKISWTAELRYNKAVVKRDGQVIYTGAPASNGYFTDTNLDAQTTYEYTVEVYDSKNNVTGSDTITVTTQQEPPAETGDENFYASDVQFNRVTLTWKPIDGATYYMLYRFNGTKQEFAKVVYAPKISFTDTTVDGGTTYKYKLVPKVGTKFTEPLELTVTTKSAEMPVAPTLNSVTVSNNGVIKVKATNNDASASLYAVFYDANGTLKSRTAISSGVEKEFKGFAAGTYTVKIEAYNRSYRTSSYSDPQTVTLTPEMVNPPVPQNLAVTVTPLDATYTLITSTVDAINDPEVSVYFYLYAADGKLISNALGKKTADGKIGWDYRVIKANLAPGQYKVVSKAMKFNKYSELVEKPFTIE